MDCSPWMDLNPETRISVTAALACVSVMSFLLPHATHAVHFKGDALWARRPTFLPPEGYLGTFLTAVHLISQSNLENAQ